MGNMSGAGKKHFALCFNDAYVPYACVTIQSILNHADSQEDIQVHIVSDYISDDNQQILQNLGNIQIHIIENGAEIFKDIKDSIWSIYTWFRVLLPSILDCEIHKLLYLDCDVVVNDSLDELFSIDMEDKAVGGCLDIQTYDKEVFARLGYHSDKKYICAGVLMMNLDKWREMDLAHKIIKFAEQNPARIVFPDQDAINYICQDDKIIFPNRYGVIVPFFRSAEFIKDHLGEMNTLMKHPAIIHYAGYAPWNYAKNKSLHAELWWSIYNSLGGFSRIRVEYWMSFIKYSVRYLLTKLHLIGAGNKYCLTTQYYNHRKITEKDVRLLVDKISKGLC